MSTAIIGRSQAGSTAFAILGAITFCHLLNDVMSALLPAIDPILKSSFRLSFGQIGLLALTFQVTASLLQPIVGVYIDRRPQPYSLTVGMFSALLGIVTLAFAPNFPVLVIGAALLGVGGSVFHPEASRLARLASGGAHGLAQSLFQVGGNFGQALGPLLAAFFILPRGRSSLAWIALAALVGMFVLAALGRWYKKTGHANRTKPSSSERHSTLPSSQVRRAITVLIALIFSKYFYMASITSYYIFYLMKRFDLTTQMAQVCLFVFLAATAAGIMIGGPVGDRIRPQDGHLGLNPRCAAIYADAALCRPDDYDCSQRHNWLRAFVGILSDSRLCPGADARPGRHGLGSILRPCFQHGRCRRRRTGCSRRPHQHRVRLSHMLVSSANRLADSLSSGGTGPRGATGLDHALVWKSRETKQRSRPRRGRGFSPLWQ